MRRPSVTQLDSGRRSFSHSPIYLEPLTIGRPFSCGPLIPEDGFAQDDRNRDHQPDEQNDDGERRHRITASLPEDALSAQVYRERDPERDERGDEDDGERCHRIHS